MLQLSIIYSSVVKSTLQVALRSLIKHMATGFSKLNEQHAKMLVSNIAKLKVINVTITLKLQLH